MAGRIVNWIARIVDAAYETQNPQVSSFFNDLRVKETKPVQAETDEMYIYIPEEKPAVVLPSSDADAVAKHMPVAARMT